MTQDQEESGPKTQSWRADYLLRLPAPYLYFFVQYMSLPYSAHSAIQSVNKRLGVGRPRPALFEFAGGANADRCLWRGVSGDRDFSLSGRFWHPYYLLPSR